MHSLARAVYECADGGFVAVGAIEPQFYKALLQGLAIDPTDDLWSSQMDVTQWPAYTKRLAALFRSKARREWDTIFAGKYACVTPVLDWNEMERGNDRQLIVDVRCLLTAISACV